MKEKFFGYIPYNEKEFENLWKEATFVFDANILLNFYRYSNDMKEQMFNNIETLSERVWIPYQTAKEFFDNRVKVIAEQENVYKSFEKKMQLSSQKDEINKIRHSSLSSKKEKMLDIIEDCEKKIKNIIQEDKKNDKSLFNNDNILERILKIFDGKIGNVIDEEKYKTYKNTIDVRYSNNIPPGYKDKDKDEDKKYGDAINWLEVIEFSKQEEKNIIYITDDKKADWFEKIGGKVVGPRKEMLQEFYKETNGNIIYLYSTEMFLKGFQNYIEPNQIVKDEYIEEIKDINETINYNELLKNILDSKIYGENFKNINKEFYKEWITGLNTNHNRYYINEENIKENKTYIEYISEVIEEQVKDFIDHFKQEDGDLTNIYYILDILDNLIRNDELSMSKRAKLRILRSKIYNIINENI